jgi:hypothetical protein
MAKHNLHDPASPTNTNFAQPQIEKQELAQKATISGYAVLVFLVTLLLALLVVYCKTKQPVLGKYWQDVCLWLASMIVFYLLTLASMYVFSV